MSKTNLKKLFVFFAIACILLIAGSTFASSEKGVAGGKHLFTSYGVGARAMALGNAFVAMPYDASAVYWNAAGMEYIQNKSVSFFYSKLLADAQYSFVGYVHPTVNLGSFGVGIINVGVGGIPVKSVENIDEGQTSLQESQFLLSYAKQLPWNLSAGISMKVDYFSMFGAVDSGIGADIGVLYKPSFTNILLKNLSLGVNIQNIVEPQLRPKNETDYHQLNMKFGLAKPISINQNNNVATLFIDFEQGVSGDGFKYHAGTEYVFYDRAMLRVGINDSQIAFGAGVVYNSFQLDYCFGKHAPNEFDAMHRISFSASFGKSKDEMIRIAKARQMEEIEKQVREKMEWERNEKIVNALDEGKRYFDDDDYLRAIQEFNIVLGFEQEVPEAMEIQEAKDMMEIALDRYNKKRDKELAEAQALEEKERKEMEDQIFINEHFQKGLIYRDKEDFQKAIEEWEMILERQPDHPLALAHIEKAKVDYKIQIHSHINRAKQYARKANYSEAINSLEKAVKMNPKEQTLLTQIEKDIVAYRNKLGFAGIFKEGQVYEIRKQFKKAADAYKKALELEPGNAELKKKYEDMQARANATDKEMTPDMKTAYLKSLRLMRAGKYKEALDILEDLRKIQPYNKEILDGIDKVRERISNN